MICSMQEEHTKGLQSSKYGRKL